MKIWIYLDGRQQGPFEFAQLPIDSMDPTTPVWYEGLANWLPAGQAPATANLFADFQNPQSHAQATADEISEVDVEIGPVVNEQDIYIDDQHRPSGVEHGVDWEGGASSPRSSGRSYAASQAGEAPEPCPPSYLVWSILLTVLCCNPIGIVAIVLGLNVGSKYRNYNYEGARKASEATAWWLMITIVTSLMSLPLSMLSLL